MKNTTKALSPLSLFLSLSVHESVLGVQKNTSTGNGVTHGTCTTLKNECSTCMMVNVHYLWKVVYTLHVRTQDKDIL